MNLSYLYLWSFFFAAHSVRENFIKNDDRDHILAFLYIALFKESKSKLVMCLLSEC
jgi:hypothetical protein